MKTILNSKQVNEVLNEMAENIAVDAEQYSHSIAFVGVRTRGEIVAQRLAKLVQEKLKKNVECGTLDITLYRDDINSHRDGGILEVKTTEIKFNVDDKIIILVDDVLHTGRSARAALDALTDLGRPKAIKLAVMIERQGRELPIQADYTGFKTEANHNGQVLVNLVESDQVDQVIVK